MKYNKFEEAKRKKDGIIKPIHFKDTYIMVDYDSLGLTYGVSWYNGEHLGNFQTEREAYNFMIDFIKLYEKYRGF